MRISADDTMSTRGIKHQYSVGEYILCFEPDSTKARVLYNAKILETTVAKDKDGIRVPAYHVHFLGWNKIWDRIVPESFLLKDDPENRILMRKLADATKRYRDNRARNRYINSLLQDAANEQLGFMGQTSGSEDENEEEGYNLEEDMENFANDSQEEDQDSVDGSIAISNKTEEKKIQEVNLEIPELLKEILEEDFIALTKENMLGRLPAKPNVINILEGFVKSFSINMLCNSPDKRYTESQSYATFDRHLSLCKELADGLRICFDHTLPLILLYNSEKDQYQKILKSFKYKPDPDSKTDSLSSPLVRTPLSACKQPKSVSVAAEPSPKIPRLSPKVFKKEKIDNEVPKPIERHSRRMTRQTVQDCGKNSQNITDINHHVLELEKQSERTPVKKHKRRKMSELEHLTGTVDNSSNGEVIGKNQKEGLTSRRNDIPPPLLLPTFSSSQCGGHSSSSTSSNDASDPRKVQENTVESVLSWQLIPDSVATSIKSSPSMIYGAHHLLRLFVKLPDLILAMKMDDKKLQVLLELLERFLDYMVKRKADIFPADNYVDA